MDTSEVTRRYRLNQWTQIIRECQSSGLTIAAWCAENNISPRSYYYWLRRVRTAAYEALPSRCPENNSIVLVNIPALLTGTNQKGDQRSTAAKGKILITVRKAQWP